MKFSEFCRGNWKNLVVMALVVQSPIAARASPFQCSEKEAARFGRSAGIHEAFTTVSSEDGVKSAVHPRLLCVVPANLIEIDEIRAFNKSCLDWEAAQRKQQRLAVEAELKRLSRPDSKMTVTAQKKPKKELDLLANPDLPMPAIFGIFGTAATNAEKEYLRIFRNALRKPDPCSLKTGTKESAVNDSTVTKPVLPALIGPPPEEENPKRPTGDATKNSGGKF